MGAFETQIQIFDSSTSPKNDSPHAGSIQSIRIPLSDERASSADLPTPEAGKPALSEDVHQQGDVAARLSSAETLGSRSRDSYFNHSNTSSSSMESLSRFTLTSQIAQLASLRLPNAETFSQEMSSIPTASEAAKAFSSAAEQMRAWLHKANDVLTGMETDDDVQWAAATGREGLGAIEKAIGQFERLVLPYVKAIEDLQMRSDLSDVPPEEQKSLVDQMEVVLGSSHKVRVHLKTVKSQVELAMEWEELWNVVLRDIGREVDRLNLFIFEMEEKRHISPVPTESADAVSLDVQELETIVEEAPTRAQLKANHRFSLPAAFSADSPLTSPVFAKEEEDQNVIALFARMQPLRASLDFLPMRLSNFQTRAEESMPSACKDLESRRKVLEKKWRVLQKDAETLKKELSEDRWIDIFRNAGRQAGKLCESLEHSRNKVQELIDAGSPPINSGNLLKKIENYQARKTHYGEAIGRVLGIIEKGVKDRQTINGEILRLHVNSRARWASLEAKMKETDLTVEDRNANKNQQLRDSVSTILSIDRSAPGSAVDTPGSSPASSVVGTPNGKFDTFPHGINGASRRGSHASRSTSRLSSSRRVFTVPSNTRSTQVPHKTPVSRSMSHDNWSRGGSPSPSPYSRNPCATPTPGSGPRRQSLTPLADKPRWNSSPKIEHNDYRPPKLPAHLTPSSGRKSSLSFRSPSSMSSPYNNSGLPLPSPLGRACNSSPIPQAAPSTLPHRPPFSSGAQSSLDHRVPSNPKTPSTVHRSPLSRQASFTQTPSSSYPPLPSSAKTTTPVAAATTLLESPEQLSPSKPAAKSSPRPATAMASSRRISFLPQPKKPISPLMTSGAGRESSMGQR
ncbi:MAG: hypothetical protein L6R37_004336 [Teloschistes peruensis]|nr:MAG: hypothetical protein L6R37_004336 [Teloschistes peruensis]